MGRSCNCCNKKCNCNRFLKSLDVKVGDFSITVPVNKKLSQAGCCLYWNFSPYAMPISILFEFHPGCNVTGLATSSTNNCFIKDYSKITMGKNKDTGWITAHYYLPDSRLVYSNSSANSYNKIALAILSGNNNPTGQIVIGNIVEIITISPGDFGICTSNPPKYQYLLSNPGVTGEAFSNFKIGNSSISQVNDIKLKYKAELTDPSSVAAIERSIFYTPHTGGYTGIGISPQELTCNLSQRLGDYTQWCGQFSASPSTTEVEGVASFKYDGFFLKFSTQNDLELRPGLFENIGCLQIRHYYSYNIPNKNISYIPISYEVIETVKRSTCSPLKNCGGGCNLLCEKNFNQCQIDNNGCLI